MSMKQLHEKHKEITIRENGTYDVGTVNNEPSMTQQEHEKACNINNIMAQYKQHGTVTVPLREGHYGDHSSIPDYQTALDTVIAAERSFNSLPSDTRSRFGNDPQKMIEFLKDEKNKDEAIKLGLVNPPAEPTHEHKTLEALNEIKQNTKQNKNEKADTHKKHE